jgi:mercuric ion transport protein
MPVKEGLLAGGGLLAALAASTCCVLPLSLGAAGLGGAWLSTLAALAPYQTAFQLLAIALLGAGFWLIYARPARAASAGACATAPTHRTTKALLWTGAMMMTLVLTSGWWQRFVVA